MKVTEGRPNLSTHTDRSSLVRQPRQKVKLNLKVILVGSSVYLHLNVFDLPSSKALRQTGGGNYAQLQVSVSPFLLIPRLPVHAEKDSSFKAGKL